MADENKPLENPIPKMEKKEGQTPQRKKEKTPSAKPSSEPSSKGQYSSSEKKPKNSTPNVPKNSTPNAPKNSTPNAPKRKKVDSAEVNKKLAYFEDVFSMFGKSVKKMTGSEVVEETKNFIQGPLRLITEPLAKSGISLSKIFDFNSKKRQPKRSNIIKTNPEAVYIADTIEGIEKTKTRSNMFRKIFPKRSSLIKTNPESVYIADTIEKWYKKQKKKDETWIDRLKSLIGTGGLIGMVLGKGTLAAIGKKVFPILMKALPIAGIATSLIWGVIDGIQGAFKSEQWGVSKVEGFIGGFLSGTEEGWKNAFKNAGKWAIGGASAGFIAGGPVGALAGGFLGAAIGGILGYIGGQKTAQAVDKVIDWMKTNYTSVIPLAGAVTGFGAGLILGGPIGGIVGGLLGLALSGLITSMMDGVPMSRIIDNVMANPTIMGLAGALSGGTLGFVIGGPVGLIVGALLGAALGGILGAINDPSAEIKARVEADFTKKYVDVVKKATNGRGIQSIHEYKEGIEKKAAEMNAAIGANIFVPQANSDGRTYRMIVDNEAYDSYVESLVKKELNQINPTSEKNLYNKNVVDPRAVDATGKAIKDFLWRVEGNNIQYQDPINPNKYITLENQKEDKDLEFLMNRFVNKYGQVAYNQMLEKTPPGEDGKKHRKDVLTSIINSGIVKFHTGGLSKEEQLAILKRNEEVLSPIESKRYREYNSTVYDSFVNAINKYNANKEVEKEVNPTYNTSIVYESPINAMGKFSANKKVEKEVNPTYNTSTAYESFINAMSKYSTNKEVEKEVSSTYNTSTVYDSFVKAMGKYNANREVEKEVNSTYNTIINSRETIELQKEMITVLKGILDKDSKSTNNVVQQNLLSRYIPDNFMNAVTIGVE